ncbi:MAG: non-ribosomal peptide synthetase [Ginsengibacter sp.]
MINPGILLGARREDLIKDETLADIFKETAAKYPNKIALIFDEKEVTYHQLDVWSNEVAEYLLNKGIGKGSFVGIWHPRGLRLHVAVLAIVKAGATYVPVDVEMPVERVKEIMMEVGAVACFTLELDQLGCESIQVLPFPHIPEKTYVLPKGASDQLAYVLYTSGSTGKPKGIPISQKQICHLVRSEQTVLNIQPTDKVYQGFSISFDMWCEETWISFHAGATLFVADAITAKAIDELSQVLRENHITVLHAVPSLLSIMDTDIPTLRLVNAGGEACTTQVLEKWGSTSSRHFYNSYGPTETTVTSSMIKLTKGDEITIGDPLPNYNYGVIDANFNLLAVGEEGELVISGPGVGIGYINLPQLTSSKFIDKPDSFSELPGQKLYRTGDAVIIDSSGKVRFQGRMDDQVKLRGYRIELGEIENRLSIEENIISAAVAVKKDNNDQDQLIAYVVTEKPELFDENKLKDSLGKVLAPYMVPSMLVLLPEMPRLPSGKINRKLLPLPHAFTIKETKKDSQKIDLSLSISDRVLQVLHFIFPERHIDLSMDFFTDLGGHSLLAAKFVSRLRKEGEIKAASLKDIYLNRPLSALVKGWEEKEEESQSPEEIFNKIPRSRFYACWIAQTISLFVVFGFFAGQIFFPYLGYYYTQQDSNSTIYAIVVALLLFCLIPPILSFLSVALKWMVIGKMKEGDYPLWGTYYFRWWFVKTIQNVIPVQFLNGTPLYNIYLRWMGVNVSNDAQLSNFKVGAEDLITIGKNVTISSSVILNNAWVEKGMLKLRSINIGDNAYIGTRSIIGPGAEIKEWGEIKDLSYLRAGKTIEKKELWEGSPAKLVKVKEDKELDIPETVSENRRFRFQVYYSVLLLIFPFAVLIPFLPVLATLNELDNNADPYDFQYLFITPVLSLLYTFLFAIITIVITRLLQRKVKPGIYSVYSSLYVKKWLADQFMSLSLMVMHPVYATVYIANFFRALGAKVGKYTEISTASNVTHPLLSIGKASFIADGVILGESDVRSQKLILEQTSVGDKTFVGNSALIPQGYHLPSNMLLGVLSAPPSIAQLSAKNASKDWFGSPAIALPKRQDSGNFDDALTLRPSRKTFLSRAAVEIIRIMIPETVLLCMSVLFIAFVHDLLVDNDLWQFFLLFPFYYVMIIGIPCFLTTVILKWIFVGKYFSWQRPMWTSKVWKSEAITTIYEALAVPFFLEFLKGTPWLPLVIKVLGVKTGERVWMNTTDITEYDMVSIGTDSALNIDCGPQTHLFEDRVMKVGKVKIGERNSIGAASIILYNAELGNDVQVEPLSLVMKGEVLPENTKWGGSPVRKT